MSTPSDTSNLTPPEQLALPPPPNRPALPPPAPPKRRRWPWILAILAAIFIIWLLSSGAGAKKAPAKAEPAAAITIGQSKSGDMNIYIEALGTVTPLYTVTVYSQITGRVMNVYYHEGQMVKEGDALVEIDPRPYQAMLTQAEGNLAHDQGLLAEARIDLQRYRDALARNAIARQQFEDQEQVVVQYEGTVKSDQGTVDYDQTQLSYCHIASPITGRVGLRLVDPGNTVFAGSASTLVVITQLQPITVVFTVSEDDLPQVQSQLRGGRALKVDAFDRSNEKQITSGALTSLDNEVDTTTGTVKFRAEFPNQNDALFPNQFVNARLLLKTLHNATLVPNAAVQHNGTTAFVYLVKSDNTVAVQNINPLTNDDQDTAVTGIGPGVDVATSGFDRLEAGVHVTARGPQGPQAHSTGGSTSTGAKE